MDDDSDDVEGEYLSSDDSEDDGLEESSLSALRAGKLVVKNSDGTLRCPYSPSRKKQSYAYKDLCQHAEGVSKGKRGAQAASEHKALLDYLRTDLASLATPPVRRMHKLELESPQRKDVEDFVLPWSGLIYNIDNRSVEKGMHVGPGEAEIKQHFEVFNPEKAHTCWDFKGHNGIAVLTFRSDLEGLKDALAFENWFIQREHGRKDWERNMKGNLGGDLYGWLARKSDYDGRREVTGDHLVALHLQSKDLKDVGTLGEEMKKIHEQRFNCLVEDFSKKRKECQLLSTEIEIARRNAEQLEAVHKQELQELEMKARLSADEHLEAMEIRNQLLQTSMESLKKKCKELEDKQKRAVLEPEKSGDHWQNLVTIQRDMIQKHQDKQVKLIRKHKEEKEKLAVLIQNMKLQLENKQQNEVRLQRREEMLETETFQELTEMVTPLELEESGKTENLVAKLKSMEAQTAKYAEEIESLRDENDDFTKMVNVLSQKERKATEEMEDARKLSVEALLLPQLNEHAPFASIRVKRMGKIDDEPWKTACRQRYKYHADGWEMECSMQISKWQDVLSSSTFQPFKTVQIGQEDEWELQVDHSNPKLQALKRMFGEEVSETVLTAWKEIDEYNASGRYPVPIAWNFDYNRRATLGEVIEHLMVVIQALSPLKKGGKRGRSG